MRRPLSIPAPNLIDRLVGYFNPVSGLKRQHARTVLNAVGGGYMGGRKDRRATRSWRPHENSADADTLPDLVDLRSRSRDLVRNAPIATGAINTTVTSVIGDGLQLKPELDRRILGMDVDAADEWERAAAREWAIFKKTVDFSSVQHFDDLQSLVFRSVLESGDIVCVRRFREDFGDRYGTKLQVVEADRLSNPNRSADGKEAGPGGNKIFGGVEISADGRHMAYHVADVHPGAIRPKQGTWRRIPARDRNGRKIVLHLYDRLRADLSRGVPYLAPVIEALKQVSDFAEAEITAAVVGAMFTAFVTSSDDSPIDTDLDKTTVKGEDEISLGNGMIVDLNPGENITFADPNRPNNSFEPFMVMFLRQIGVALELPFELLIKHFTSSFSASRAALETAWKFFNKRRVWIARSLNQPIYEWMIEEAILRGYLAAPGFFSDPVIRMAYCGCSWIGPPRIQVDPFKEANADKVDIELGTKTRAQVIMERTGGTWEAKHEQTIKEHRARAADGLSSPAAAASVAADPDDNPDDEGSEDAK